MGRGKARDNAKRWTPQRSKAEGEKHGGRFDEHVALDTEPRSGRRRDRGAARVRLVVLGERDAHRGAVRIGDDREPGAACRVIHGEGMDSFARHEAVGACVVTIRGGEGALDVAYW